MISINTYRYNRTLLYNMYIAYHIQSNLERGGVSTKEISTIFSLLAKKIFLRGESVESWKNNRHDCADCSEWRISFSVWYWTTISKKKRKKRKKRNVPRVRVSITSRIERAIDIWRILSGLETEHPRFAIYATDSTRWKFEAASSFNYRL